MSVPVLNTVVKSLAQIQFDTAFVLPKVHIRITSGPPTYPAVAATTKSDAIEPGSGVPDLTNLQSPQRTEAEVRSQTPSIPQQIPPLKASFPQPLESGLLGEWPARN